MSGPMLGSEREMAAAVERWFRRHARDLPWRRHRDGYTALVSEAMLQQTQVSRVLERYEAFMRRFPTIEALAAADEQDVLAMWRGLGYYRRARNLHAAAAFVVEEFGGDVPRAMKELLRLPGVGRYTAGAIASIVFGAREPLVDGNVRRVLARWFAEREADDPWCWERAGRLVTQADDPAALNEGLMELGATVCTPGSRPACETCPVAKWCEARRRGEQGEIPAAKRRPDKATLHFHAVIVRRGRKIYVEQRGENGLWSRMWQPPTVESPRKLAAGSIRRAVRLPIDGLRHRASFDHHTTHRHLVFDVYETTSRARRGVWRSPEDLDDLPMSNAHRRAVELVVANASG